MNGADATWPLSTTTEAALPAASYLCASPAHGVGLTAIPELPGSARERSEQVTKVYHDVKTQGNPAWRPPHYPPPCEACGGFGYTRPSWSACRACKASPGHAMTFNQWTELRGA